MLIGLGGGQERILELGWNADLSTGPRSSEVGDLKTLDVGLVRRQDQVGGKLGGVLNSRAGKVVVQAKMENRTTVMASRMMVATTWRLPSSRTVAVGRRAPAERSDDALEDGGSPTPTRP